MKLKKVLAAALAGTMVMASLTAVSAETLNDMSISDFLGNMNDGTAQGIAVSGDFDLTLTFNCVGDREKASELWNNFTIRVMENTDTPDDLYFRADNWSWIYEYETAITYNCDNSVSDGTTIDWYSHTDYDGDWDAWLAAMQEGSDCTVSLTRSGNLFTAVMECGGATFTISCEPSMFDSDLTVYLTGEQCKLTGIEYTLGGSTEATATTDETEAAATTDETEATTTTDTTDTTSTTDTTDTTATTTTTNDSTTQTGDAAPIAAVAVALIGCAAIAFASKKRFA